MSDTLVLHSQKTLHRLLSSACTASDVTSNDSPLNDYLPQIISQLRTVIESVPLSTTFLTSMITKHFPHKGRSLQVQIDYTQVLIALARHFPHLKPAIFDLLIDRCLVVDHD